MSLIFRRHLVFFDLETTGSDISKDRIVEISLVKLFPDSKEEIQSLVINDKWMTAIANDVKSEMERISQRLTQRIKKLAERYETPLPDIDKHID
jgi:type I restriction enzyme M protein